MNTRPNLLTRSVLKSLHTEARSGDNTDLAADCDAALNGDKSALERCLVVSDRAMKEEEESDPNDLFEAVWDGTVDGEAFDGDPADLW